eukprot:4616684-Pyramimonas_sp.AAC.1
MALRRFSTKAELNAAVGAWHDRMRQLVGDSTDGRVSMQATFASNCMATADLYKCVQAMGVQIVAAPGKGQQVLAPPPYAFPNGDTAQPGLEITWRLSPA